jgi:hypothetical protein
MAVRTEVCENLRERPRLSHNGKTDLVSSEQPSRLLPCHGSELNVMFVVYEAR